MVSKFLVVRNGISKKTGAIYSMAQRMGKSKDGKSEFLFEKDTYFTDDIRPVGSMIEVEQMELPKK